jgi:RNA polymerase sigma factor (sigma-70 family)
MSEAWIADEDLVGRARDGDVEAYAILIQRYQPLVVGLAALVMRNSADADDVAQEAFLKAYYALDRFRPGASFKAWLVRIVVNEARNTGAAAKRRVELHGRFREVASRTPASVSAEETALANEQRSALLAALDRLRDDDRAVLVFRYVFDLSEAEMAEALGCSPGTVKSRLSRALARLRGDLKRVAPLLAISPNLGTLAGQSLSGTAASPGIPAHAFAAAILQRVTSHLAPPAGSTGNGRPTVQQVVGAVAGGVVVVALAATGFLLSTSDRPAPPATPGAATSASPQVAAAAAPASTPSFPVFVLYGGDLTDAQRQELNGTFATDAQTTTGSVTRDELVATLQAAGLPTDGSERAISSVVVACLHQGDGLRVRTLNITELPAAAYANALVSAGIADASVTVAAPPSTPMSGETALVGVLKAYPRCHSGQASPPERLRLASDQLRATADMAQASGAWDRAASVMLRAAQAAIASPSPDEAALGAALDEAAAAQGVSLDAERRAETVSVLSRLSALDHGAYASGYVVEHSAADEVRVMPSGGPARLP